MAGSSPKVLQADTSVAGAAAAASGAGSAPAASSLSLPLPLPVVAAHPFQERFPQLEWHTPLGFLFSFFGVHSAAGWPGARRLTNEA